MNSEDVSSYKNPIPIKAITLHLFDVYIYVEADAPSLDFVLCYPNSVPEDADGGSGGVSSDRDAVMDYSWLNDSTMPQSDAGDPVDLRIERLIQWIQRSYLDKCADEISGILQSINNKLSFDYDSYLSTLCGAGGRRVEVVYRSLPDYLHLGFSIPLLQSQGEKVCESLESIFALYSKLSRMTAAQTPPLSQVDFSLIILFKVNNDSNNMDVVKEEVAIKAHQTSPLAGMSPAELLSRTIALDNLPLYSHQFYQMLQRDSACMMDFIPVLEEALINKLQEPLHFLQLLEHMSLLCGMPVDINMKSSDDRVPNSAVTRIAMFSFVPPDTNANVTITVHHRNSYTLPNVDVCVAVAGSAPKKTKEARGQIKYPNRMDQEMKTDANFPAAIDVTALSEATVLGCMDTIATLLNSCK
uniref:WGS project CAEQ00000000 data, annotated contig 1319 n=1 Tax=Trypanosoma congolense (strain IL3000) TaxID=1068625 RepID=F9W5E8_TRYCI|nr:unnamed protein product [Trypanosoma congolense IL3000]